MLKLFYKDDEYEILDVLFGEEPKYSPAGYSFYLSPTYCQKSLIVKLYDLDKKLTEECSKNLTQHTLRDLVMFDDCSKIAYVINFLRLTEFRLSGDKLTLQGKMPIEVTYIQNYDPYKRVVGFFDD